MDIIVTSGTQNPSNFVSNFVESININDGYEIAVKSVCHAPLYNITEDNNEFTVSTNLTGNVYEYSYSIPSGFYENTCEVLLAMQNTIATSLSRVKRVLKPPKWTPSLLSDPQKVILNMNNRKRDEAQHFVLGGGAKDSLLRDLGMCSSDKILLPKLEVSNYVFDNSRSCGFLYSNIVTNSMINQQQSRLLACLPIDSKPGCNYYEFQNPTYRALSVHSFTDLNFVLTDVEGNILRMKSDVPTVIALSIRKQ